jgi:type IV pilus assembly protein PilW
MSARRNAQRTDRSRNRGVSLIELMVSLVIGLLLIGGAIKVYSNSRGTFRTNEAAARMQETGRYALGVIEPDVRLAGFWGMTNRPDIVENSTVNADIGNNCATNWIGTATKFIDAVDNLTTYTPGCTLAETAMPNSDVLIVRRADSRVLAAPVDKAVQIQSNRVRAVIFKGTTLPSGFSSTTSETRNMVGNIYYVAKKNGTKPASLHRLGLVNEPTGASMKDVEIATGVENMQLQLGVDTNGDTTADRYVNPGSVGAGRVVSVRIWLRIVAEDRDADFRSTTAFEYANATFAAANDDKRRVLLSKTIQIRNSKP